MFEGFVDESAAAAPAGIAPGPELGEHLVAADLLAPDPSPADHSPAGEDAWQEAVGAGLDRVAGWARMTAWAQAQEMLTVESLVSAAVERAEQRPRGTPLDGHVGGIAAEVDSVTAELALTWQVAQRTATRRVDEAVSLVSGLPLLVEAMVDGRLGLAHVHALAGVLLDLAPELREKICRDLLEDTAAGRPIARTPAQLAGTARRAAIRLDPSSARRRERAAARERGVHLGAEADGMATVTAYLPAAEALLLYRTIDAHVRGVTPADLENGEDGDRSPDARRADALCDLVTLGALAASGARPEPDAVPDDAVPDEDAGHERCTCPPPCRSAETRSSGEDPDAPIPAPRSSDDSPDDDVPGSATEPVPRPARPEPPPPEPLGSEPPGTEPDTKPPGTTPPAERPGGTPRSSPRRARGRRPRDVQVRVVVSADTLLGLDERPAELVGYGPITAGAARALAAEADATWRRVLTDPASGAVLDVGHRRYRPPAALAEHVRHRDLTCTFPGCRVPAQACDLDHVVRFDPHDPAGRTAADNLDPDCRHHHRIKHLPGWTVARGADGSLLWTTPSGRRYRTVRPVLLPITTEPPATTTAAGSAPGTDPAVLTLGARPSSPTTLIRGSGHAAPLL